MILILSLMLCAEVVNNDITPANAVPLKISHQFTLGEDSDDDLFFGEGTKVVANQKHIFVLDPGNFRVIVFDVKGQVVKEFGKQGQGPGEFQTPIALALNSAGYVVVFDTGLKRMSVFDKEGALQSETRIEQGIQHIEQPAFLGNGNLMMSTIKTDAQFQMTYDFSLYDPQASPVKNYHSEALPPTDWSKASEPDFWVEFLVNQFEAIATGFTIGVPLGDQSGAVMMTNTAFEGSILAADGTVKSSFNKKIKRKGFTDEAKFSYCEGAWESMTANPFLETNITRAVFEKAAKKAELPDFLTPVSGLFRLGKGFGVISNYDPLTEEGRLDYFDSSGHCKAYADFKGPKDDVFGLEDRLYTVGTDAEDSVVVMVYRIEGLPK